MERHTIPQRLDGRIIGRVWSFRDITEHRRTEESLRSSEARFETFMNYQTTLAFLKDEQGRYLFINQSYLKQYGLDPELRIGKTDEELWPPEVAARLKANDQIVMSSGQPGEFTEMIEVDGRTRINLSHRFPVELSDGKKALGGVALDITDRVMAEEALAEEKERLGITLNSIAEGVITVAESGLIESMNPVAQSLTGWTADRATARTLAEVLQLSPENDDSAAQQLEGLLADAPLSRRLSLDCLLTDRSGRQRVVTITASPISGGGGGKVIVFRDITRQRRREAENFKAAKLESVGQLAGGLAHDFNNLLSAILGNISLARMDLEGQEAVDRALATAEESCLRARDLTRQLLTFAKGGAPVRERVDLGQLISQTASFALRGSASKCELDFGPELKPGRADAAQLNQALANVILNADQAMVHGGVIRLKAANDQDEKGDWVKISVDDQGPGLDPNLLPRLFDPYFSTREGRAGLGLAVAHSVVSQHGGRLIAENLPRGGARFTILLPVSSADMPSLSPPVKIEPAGRKRVLVMDDEHMIRDVVSAMLAKLGCETETARDGAEAVEAFRRALEANRPYDLVILDLTIPGGMGGKEAIQKLLDLDPRARAVVSSGYSQDPVMATPREYGFTDVVAKPFRLHELEQLLQRVFKNR